MLKGVGQAALTEAARSAKPALRARPRARARRLLRRARAATAAGRPRATRSAKTGCCSSACRASSSTRSASSTRGARPRATSRGCTSTSPRSRAASRRASLLRYDEALLHALRGAGGRVRPRSASSTPVLRDYGSVARRLADAAAYLRARRAVRLERAGGRPRRRRAGGAGRLGDGGHRPGAARPRRADLRLVGRGRAAEAIVAAYGDGRRRGARAVPPASRGAVARLGDATGTRPRSTRTTGRRRPLRPPRGSVCEPQADRERRRLRPQRRRQRAASSRRTRAGIVTSASLMVRWPDARGGRRAGPREPAACRSGCTSTSASGPTATGSGTQVYEVVPTSDEQAVAGRARPSARRVRADGRARPDAPRLAPARPSRRSPSVRRGDAGGGRRARCAAPRGARRRRPTAATSTGRATTASRSTSSSPPEHLVELIARAPAGHDRARLPPGDGRRLRRPTTAWSAPSSCARSAIRASARRSTGMGSSFASLRDG